MGLKGDIIAGLNIKDVKRVQYFDARYYKVLYEVGKGKEKQLLEEHMPSVTEILGVLIPDFLPRWRGDVGNERADQIISDAFRLGSFIHFGAEMIAKGGAVIFNPIENPIYTDEQVQALKAKHDGKLCVARFQAEFLQLYRIWQFFMLTKPEEVETEQTVFSVEHKFAGTLDGIGKFKGGEYMIAGSKPIVLEDGYYVYDFKTGKGISRINERQLSSYMEAVMEGKPDMRKKLKGGLLLHPNATLVKNGIAGFKAHLVTMKDQPQLFDEFKKIYDVYKIEKPVPTPTEFSMPTCLTLVEGKKR